MHRRPFFPSMLVVIVLVFSAFAPMTAFAQDELPPPADPAGEEAPPPDETATEEAPAPEEVTTDEVTLPEVLEAAPEGTEVVVLDEAGNEVPLASDAAADALVSGDPMWCPDGQLPGGAGCTIPHTSFTDLFNDLNANPGDYSGNGTIYVAFDYAGGSGFFEWDGGNNLNNLTIQGGWNGLLDGAGYALSGTSTINGSLWIEDWGDVGTQLTLNDLVFSSGGGVYLYDDGGTLDAADADITFNNVSVTGADFQGAHLMTNGNVEINDSDFTGNDSSGLQFNVAGNVTLNNVDASDNWEEGVTGWMGGDFTVNGGAFNYNGDDGVDVGGYGAISLTDVDASENQWDGLDLYSDYRGISLTNVETEDNGSSGIQVYANGGDVTLNGVSASDNGGDGLEGWADDDLIVTNSTFNYNSGVGIDFETYDDATLDDVTANLNFVAGIWIISDEDIDATDVTANWNILGSGLRLIAEEEVTLSGITAMYNGRFGTYVNNVDDEEDVTVSNSTFMHNGWWSNYGFGDWAGLSINSEGDVTISNVNASENIGDGLSLGDYYDPDEVGYYYGDSGSFESLLIQDSSFNDNWSWSEEYGNGVYAHGYGDITVLNSEAMGNYNDWGDAVGMHLGSWFGNIFVDPSTFSFNQSDGLYAHAEYGDITVQCSTFVGNGGLGVHGDADGALSLYGNTFSGNGGGDAENHYSGEIVIDSSDADCQGGADPKPLPPPAGGPTWNVVDVSGSETTGLDCEAYRGTVLVLSNGDKATLPCPLGDEATLKHSDEDELPGELGDEFAMQSAMDLQVVKGGSPVDPLNPSGAVAFVIPEGVSADELTILFWNGSEWEDLGGAVNEEGLFEVSTDKIGVFVLASQ